MLRNLIASWSLLLSCSMSHAQGIWTQKASMPGAGRFSPIGFSIGSKGYVGTGYSSGYLNDFWEWDQSTNTWTQKAGFSGTPRYTAVGFSIGGNGYIGTGYDTSAVSFRKDFWEYDTLANSWTQKMDLSGAVRYIATGFSIGAKGYIGTGDDTSAALQYLNDFWEYDPALDAWTQKANFMGTKRIGAIGFSIGTKGYIGTGSDTITGFLKDFWEYDPSLNTWSQKANFPGSGRYTAAAFSIGTKGYIGTGGIGAGNVLYDDFWEWDQATNTWSQKANFGGGPRYNCTGFSIGNYGYIGFGSNLTASVVYQDFWEYSAVVGVNEKDNDSKIFVFPNPASSYLKIETSETKDLILKLFDITGRQIIHRQFRKKTEVDVSTYDKGLFFVEVCDKQGMKRVTQKVLIR